MGVGNFDRSCRTRIDPGWWRHYKGGLYYVVGTGRNTETEEAVVVYLDIVNRTWVRPLQMFLEEVTVDGVQVPRFTPIEIGPRPDLSIAPKVNLSDARRLVCRSAINYSFDHISRWRLLPCNENIPHRLGFSDHTQRISVALNYNKGTGSKAHQTPFTLSYELLQPRKGGKMETWATFSNRIERT